MKRYFNWPTLLADYIEQCSTKTFELGRFDCVQFGCGSIEAMTGQRPLSEYFGKYKTNIEAARLLKEFSGGGLPETFDKACLSLGLKSKSIEFAQRGDQVLVDYDGMEAWGFIDLDAKIARCVGYNVDPAKPPLIETLRMYQGGTTRIPLSGVKKIWGFE